MERGAVGRAEGDERGDVDEASPAVAARLDDITQPLDVDPVELPPVAHPGLDQGRGMNHGLAAIDRAFHRGTIGHVAGHRARRFGASLPARLVAAKTDHVVPRGGKLGSEAAAEEPGDSGDQDPHASSPAT